MIATLSGGNAYALYVELKRRVDEYVSVHGDIGLERISAESQTYNAILGSVQSLPFLATKKMVVISDVSGNKELIERIDELLAAITEETEVVFVEPKFDNRSVLYKTLKKQTDFHEYNQPDERELAKWLVEEAKKEAAQLSLSDANYLVQRIGTDQLRLHNELTKLALYDPIVTRKTIDILTQQTPQSSVFNLLDAAFAGDLARTMLLYDEQRQQKVEPQAILAMIAWQLSTLAVVKTASDRSVDTIAKDAKLNPFVVRKSTQIARRLSLEQVRKLVNETLQLDITLKTVQNNADTAVKTYLVKLAAL